MCVCETGVLMLFAYVALLLLPWSCFLGSGTPLFSLVGFTCSKLLACSAWLMVSCCIGGLFFGFIDASTVPSTKLRLLVVEALLMLLSQGLLLLCHLDNALRLSSYIQ